MGRKRKEEFGANDEEIRRKIRKLEEKLTNIPTRRRRIVYDSSDSSAESNDDTSQRASRAGSPIIVIHREASPRVSSPDPTSPTLRDNLPQLPLSPTKNAPPPTIPVDSTAPQLENEVPNSEELDLDDEILVLLGDAPKTDQQLGPPINKHVASRWREILLKGLQKEAKDKLLKEYLIPNNCDLLLAPKLNPEAKAALSDGLVKRDQMIMQKQSQLGIAISALASLTELIISEETSKQKLLKPLSDACRILCDSHQCETITRRNFVLSAINTNLKDTLIEAERDAYLFGENVSEKLKIDKNIQKSGDALKHQQKSVFRKSNFIANKGHLNYKQAHRKTDNKIASGAARTTRAPRPPPPPRQQDGPSGSGRRAPKRSPPPTRRSTQYRR